jgi:uncharacterized protein
LDAPTRPTRELPVSPPPQRTVPWTVRDAWLGLISLPFLIALLAGPLLYYQFATGSEVNAGLVLLVGEFAILGPVIWFAVRRKASLADLGFRRFPALGLLAGCAGLVLTYMAVMAFVAGIMLVCNALGIPLPDTSPALLLAQLPDPWLTFLVAVVAAPLTEELFFRAFFFTGLRQRFGWIWAALVSGVIFGLFHLEPLQFLPLAAFGILLAAVYQYTDSIWPPILLHAALNLVGLSAAYWLANSGLIGVSAPLPLALRLLVSAVPFLRV